MSDTSPRIRARYSEMMAQRTPAERLRMATGMFEAARRLMRAGLPDLDGAELEKELFLRMYGREISPRMRDDVLSLIDARFADRG